MKMAAFLFSMFLLIPTGQLQTKIEKQLGVVPAGSPVVFQAGLSRTRPETGDLCRRKNHSILFETSRVTGNPLLTNFAWPTPPPIQDVLLTSSVTFMKVIGSAGEDYAPSVQQTSDGGFIMAGATNGFGAGGNDILLVKLDHTGTTQWAETVGGSQDEGANAVQQTADGGYVVTGYTYSINPMGWYHLLIAKFDSGGTIQWASHLGNDSGAGHSVEQTNDGGYIVTGFVNGAYGGLGLLKYSTVGGLEWQRHKQYAFNHYGYAVQQTTDGGYIVAGSQQNWNKGGENDLTLLKFDGGGNLQWARLVGGTYHESGYSVQQTTNGGYVVAGVTKSFGAGGLDVLLLSYSASGELQWARTIGGPDDDSTDSVQQTSDGGFIIAGYSVSLGAAFLVKLDSTGVLQWAKGGSASPVTRMPMAHHISEVRQLSDGGYITVASTDAVGAGGRDILIIRTDVNGDIPGCANWAPVDLTIGTNFPIPSDPVTYSDTSEFSPNPATLSVGVAPLIASNVPCAPQQQVSIDIKPGSFPNSINLGSGGTVPVAIFSTSAFDATAIDPTTVTLASAPVKLKGKGTPMASFEDLNGDGLLDLVVHVSTEALQLSETDTQAILEGQTLSGISIRGTDSVRVVP